MFGLGQKVGGAVGWVGCFVSDEQYFTRSLKSVDADDSINQFLG